MIRIIALILLTLFQSNSNNLQTLCKEFNILNTQIRDNTINKISAQTEYKRLISLIKTAYNENKGKYYTKSDWIFPLQGYNANSIGGKNGNGYISGSYNYFDGNKHTGHPAQDIFIIDRNQDCLDDKTGQPVNVLSVTGGVVIATENSWKSESKLRGGIYAWVFNVTDNSILYYAHMKEVFVKPGDMIKPGDIIGTVGRTGLNAFAKRSPTHLHFGLLILKDNLPKAQNVYTDLLSCKSIDYKKGLHK